MPDQLAGMRRTGRSVWRMRLPGTSPAMRRLRTPLPARPRTIMEQLRAWAVLRMALEVSSEKSMMPSQAILADCRFSVRSLSVCSPRFVASDSCSSSSWRVAT